MVINGEAKAICGALVKARSDMKATVTKDGQGNYGQYATLAAIVAATTPHFATHGLAVVQEVSTDESGIVIETWLVHESGATMQFTPLVLPISDRRPQAVGSLVTYGRRYALAAICGIAPEDDDAQLAEDAHKAPQRTQRTPAPKQTQPAPKTPQGAPTPAKQATNATPEQIAALDALGSEFYAEEWSEQRGKLCRAASKGAADAPADLLQTEIAKLIEGVSRKMAEVSVATAQPIAH
jgi:hypothetical protein